MGSLIQATCIQVENIAAWSLFFTRGDARTHTQGAAAQRRSKWFEFNEGVCIFVFCVAVEHVAFERHDSTSMSATAQQPTNNMTALCSQQHSMKDRQGCSTLHLHTPIVQLAACVYRQPVLSEQRSVKVPPGAPSSQGAEHGKVGGC